jgi:hypothetical protein
MALSSEPFAGVGVAERQHEEAESGSEQDEIEHRGLL